ncbi:MAG: hypothetical protein IJP96_08020 [Synergistaceae bacterium]|nr:hypothetical protein [Synergistaceae bacterium]
MAVKKLIRKADNMSEFEIARKNLELLQECETREEIEASLKTTVIDILINMVHQVSSEWWFYEKKINLIEELVNLLIAKKEIERIKEVRRPRNEIILLLQESTDDVLVYMWKQLEPVKWNYGASKEYLIYRLSKIFCREE